MATPVKVPPKPTRDPDVHLKDRGTRKPPRTLKGDVKVLKGKLLSARSKWTEGRRKADAGKEEVRKEAARILAPTKARIDEEKALAGETVKPVHKAIAALKAGLDPKNGKTRPYVTSFMISSVASWTVGPQVLLAGYERIRFGTSTTDWGILRGPGRWFRDTIGMTAETDQTATLVWAIVIGLTPMIILALRNMGASHLAQSSYRGRLAELGIKWLTRAAYLVPLGYFVGLAYPQYVSFLFDSPWELHWWQIYVMGLFCTAYYCTMWAFDRMEKGLGLGYFHVLLMVPLASIVTGAALYAPGAAW